ncbi:Inner membrane protein YabI [Buchnera aphidicola (Eriosoma grossulariae)]|uniref:DedA family protein n=1 Tax=Buchnera aphidicola TaxID=9 RepID=UPI003464D6AC
MEYWLKYIITLPTIYLLITVTIIAFLESLAIVGLFLPGIVLMASLGTLIGNGKLLFYPAWIAGIIGCIAGDWISYYMGWKFKNFISKLNFLKKNFLLLQKTKIALYKHSFLTILIGRFIGPARPIIPLVSGMLRLPIIKFIIPNIIGCILWPPLYFLPGIFTGILIHNQSITNYNNLNNLKWILIFTIIMIWIGIWILIKCLKKYKNKQTYFFIFSIKQTLFVGISCIVIGLTTIIAIQYHPDMILLRKLIIKIFI